jgi:hypothetical protein
MPCHDGEATRIRSRGVSLSPFPSSGYLVRRSQEREHQDSLLPAPRGRVPAKRVALGMRGASVPGGRLLDASSCRRRRHLVHSGVGPAGNQIPHSVRNDIL